MRLHIWMVLIVVTSVSGITRVSSLTRDVSCFIGHTRCSGQNLTCSGRGRITVMEAGFRQWDLPGQCISGVAIDCKNCCQSSTSNAYQKGKFSRNITELIVKECGLKTSCNPWQFTVPGENVRTHPYIKYWCQGDDLCSFEATREYFKLNFEPKTDLKAAYRCLCSIDVMRNTNISLRDIRLNSASDARRCSTASLSVDNITHSCRDSNVGDIIWSDSLTFTSEKTISIELGPLGEGHDPLSVFIEVSKVRTMNSSCTLFPIPKQECLDIPLKTDTMCKTTRTQLNGSASEEYLRIPIIVGVSVTGSIVMLVMLIAVTIFCVYRLQRARNQKDESEVSQCGTDSNMRGSSSVMSQALNSVYAAERSQAGAQIGSERDPNTIVALQNGDEYNRSDFKNQVVQTSSCHTYSHVVKFTKCKGQGCQHGNHVGLRSEVTDDTYMYDHLDGNTNRKQQARAGLETYSHLPASITTLQIL